MKEEWRAVMSISNFRVMQGLDHSAQSAPNKENPLRDGGEEPQERPNC